MVLAHRGRPTRIAYCNRRRPRHLVNRYYDPSTYQFLSIDPKVATTMQPYAFVDGDPLNETDPLGFSGGWNRATLAYAQRHDCNLHGRKCHGGLGALRHWASRHKRGLAQVGIGITAVGLTIATGGASDLLVAGIGAGASLASYGAGCAGEKGNRACTVKGAVVATATGAVGAGLASGANIAIGGPLSESLTSRVAQYSSVGVLSSAVASSWGVLADSAWENRSTDWGEIRSIGFGSLVGFSDG